MENTKTWATQHSVQDKQNKNTTQNILRGSADTTMYIEGFGIFHTHLQTCI